MPLIFSSTNNRLLCRHYTTKKAVFKGNFELHSRASAGAVLIAAAAAVLAAAEAGQQKQPDQRIAGDTHAVVVVADEQKQDKQPGQIGSAEIVEHCVVPPFVLIRRFSVVTVLYEASSKMVPFPAIFFEMLDKSDHSHDNNRD